MLKKGKEYLPPLFVHLKQSNLNFFSRLKIAFFCRILRWLTDEEAVKGDYHTRIQFLIVEMSR